MSAAPPLTLGFDTSQAHCAACLLRGDEVLAAADETMAKGQAERLMPMLQETLDAGGATWGDLDRIGVGIGPGNFTGIRISVSAARGLALGLGIPAVGVSLLDALALGTNGPRLALLDARRDHVYLQGFGGAGPDEPGLYPVADIGEFCTPGCVGIGQWGVVPSARIDHRPAAFAPAAAIARIAATALPPFARPAPLYLRAPDAAPSRHAAPTLTA